MDPMDAILERLTALEAQVARLAGPHVELVASEVGPGGQIIEGPHADVVVAEGPPPGQSVADWISSLGGSPGFVVDPGLARATPCIVIELGAGRSSLVYSKGIIGALDEEQKALYCADGIEPREISDAQRERIAVMESAAKGCSEATTGKEGQDHLSAYLSCMGSELRAKGAEPW